MRRLTRSGLAQHPKVQNTQTSESSSQQAISSYFKPAAGPQSKTPNDKATLKLLMGSRETKKRHLSDSDSQNNSASENLPEAFNSSKHHDRGLAPAAHSEKSRDFKAEEKTKKFCSLSQPIPEKRTPPASAHQEARITATRACKPEGSSMGSSPLKQSNWNCQDRPGPLKDSSKSETSSSQRGKERAKSRDLGSASYSSTTFSGHKDHKTRSEHKESYEQDVMSHNRKTEKKELSSKPSQSRKGKELAHEGSRHCDKRRSLPREVHKESSSSKRMNNVYRDRAKTTKSANLKTANIKQQLLTDCGIGDSNKGGPKTNKRDKPSRLSLDSTQLADVRPVPHSSKSDGSVKRESVYDLRRKKETVPSPATATEDDMSSPDVLEKVVQRSFETDAHKPNPEGKLPAKSNTEECQTSKPAALSTSLDEVLKFPKPEASSCSSVSPEKQMQDDKRKRRSADHDSILSSAGPSSATRLLRTHCEENIPEAIDLTTPSGTTSSMEQEIQNARHVKDLEAKHISYLFERILPVLDKIIKKEVDSWRLNTYIKGGAEKRALTHKVYIHKFSEEQINLVIRLFVEEFGRRRRFNGDIINQVFIPEFLIRVFMANQGTTYEESEELMKQSLEVVPCGM